MVKYGLFAAQQAREQSSHCLSCSSRPLLKPCTVPWCRCTFTLPTLALLGDYIIHGKSERSVRTSPSLAGRLSAFPCFPSGQQKWRQLQGREIPSPGHWASPGKRSMSSCIHGCSPLDETSKWVFLSPRSLIPPSCCLFAEQQLREDNSVMKELPPNFQVWPTRSIRHFGKIKNFISNQPAFICLGINKAEEPAVATAAS